MPRAKKPGHPYAYCPHGVERDNRTYSKQITTYFDPDTFEQICELAQKRKTSFAEQVRVLVELGLITDEEMA